MKHYGDEQEYASKKYSPDEVLLQPKTWAGSIVSNIAQLIFPCVCLNGFTTVEPKEHLIVSYWGRPHKLVKKPGTYYFNPVGRDKKTVSTKISEISIANKTVNDIHGSPLKAHGLINYKIKNSFKAAFKVDNVQTYVSQQAYASLRDIAARYPFDSAESQCLRRPTDELKEEMMRDLQERVDVLGVKILNFQFTDIGYDEGMAQTLLAKQKAQADVDSRKILSEGVASITLETIQKLEDGGVKFEENEKSEAATNLLYILAHKGNLTLFINSNNHGAVAASSNS